MIENTSSYKTIEPESIDVLVPEDETGDMNSLFNELKSRKASRPSGATSQKPEPATNGIEQPLALEGEIVEGEISESDKKKCELNASLISLTIESTACIGLQFVADDFSEASEKKYSLSPEKMRKYKEAWTELMIFYNGQKISPVWGVILATVGMYMPIIIHAGKQRLKKKKAKKENIQRQQQATAKNKVDEPMIDENEGFENLQTPVLAEEFKEDPTRDSRGAKKGRRQAPDGSMQMYSGIHPEFGAVYPWETDKMKKAGFTTDWKMSKEGKKAWEKRKQEKDSKKAAKK